MALLIGANCTETLEPKEVISSRESGFYAVKTMLRWCMVGPISCTNKNGDQVRCNRVSVKEAGSQNLGKHHYFVISEVKDIGLKDMLNKIDHADFSESVQPRKFDKMLILSNELPLEDQKFLIFHFKKEINIGQTTEFKLR